MRKDFVLLVVSCPYALFDKIQERSTERYSIASMYLTYAVHQSNIRAVKVASDLTEYSNLILDQITLVYIDPLGVHLCQR